MITGTVNANREAITCLTVHDVHGQTHELEAVIDTGFNAWLTLQRDLIKSLGLRWQGYGRGQLADGSATYFDIYEATIAWDGQMQIVSIYEMEGESLVGMSLMYGYELVLPVLDGATFTLRSIGIS